MALVVLDVLRAALVVDGCGAGRDGALHGDDTHDAGAHGRVHRVLFLAGGGVLLERVGDLRMRLNKRLVGQQELEDAGRVGRQEIDLQIDLRHDALHNETDLGDLVQDLAGALDGHLGFARDHRDERRLHAGQSHHDRDLVIGDPLLQALVLRAVGSDFVEPIVDLFAQFD